MVLTVALPSAPDSYETRRCQLPADLGVVRAGIAPWLDCYQPGIDQIESLDEADDLVPGTEPHLGIGPLYSTAASRALVGRSSLPACERTGS
jgi:hypothetical protein